jgi:R67 dihydrofolate reductase
MTDIDTSPRKFKLGDFVTKVSGSQWHGRVVGFYSTDLTPIGYCVESYFERGSVQLYPEKALAEWNE